MAEVDEQRVCIKFCVRLGKTGSETFEMLKQAFGDSCMSRSRTFEWFGRFKNGRISTANDERSGRPSTATTPSKVEQVRAAVNQDRRRTIHDLCAEVGIGYGSCQRILTEQLNMHRIAAKFVPKVLTQDQKDSRVAICQELKETVINDPTLLLNVITGDESIVYAYDPQTKLQSSQWKSPGSPRPKKARMQKSKLKTMLICFFDQEGIVHREFVPPGMTVNAGFYCDVLRRLRENVRRRRPQKWQNQNLIIHHDNAPAHRSFKVSQFLAKNNMTVIPHPPYSPDLAPCDFFLFPKLKLRMKGRRFDTIEEIQEESQRVLDTIPKRDFQGCFQAWQKRWDRCIRAKGEYFEGDGGI